MNEIAELQKKIQDSIVDFKRFSKIVTLKTFVPFTSALQGLENINDISEGLLNLFNSLSL